MSENIKVPGRPIVAVDNTTEFEIIKVLEILQKAKREAEATQKIGDFEWCMVFVSELMIHLTSDGQDVRESMEELINSVQQYSASDDLMKYK